MAHSFRGFCPHRWEGGKWLSSRGSVWKICSYDHENREQKTQATAKQGYNLQGACLSPQPGRTHVEEVPQSLYTPATAEDNT